MTYKTDTGNTIWRTRKTAINISEARPLIMGILNVTPDSFYDGGQYTTADKALGHAREMIEHGADIIDIGGESTRPGAAHVNVDEELARVIPLLNRIKQAQINVPVSIDTSKAKVAAAALNCAGVDIINDVTGLTGDRDMVKVIADHNAGLVLMHSRPHSEVDSGRDVVADIRQHFDNAFNLITRYGLNKQNVVIDPGIGFGKTVKQNIDLIANLDVFTDYDCPILVGLSRKSFIRKTLCYNDKDHLLSPTLAADMMAWLRGANIVRVHDVRQHRDFFTMVAKINSSR